MLLPRPLRGVIPPLVTPFTPDLRLDKPALLGILNRMIEAGADAVFLLGTTGEGPALGREMQREVVEFVCGHAAERISVLVNVTNPALTDSLELTRFAASLGCVGVAISPPYYFPISQDELLFWVKQFAAQSPLPFFLYNMPSHARPAFSMNTVRAVAQIANAAGIKDSSGDASYWRELADEFGGSDFSVLLGPEDCLVEAFAAGAHGSVCGSGNLRVDLFVGLYRACREGRTEDADRIQAAIRHLHAVFQVAPGSSGYLRGLKCALALEGVCGDRLLPPHYPLSDSEREQVRALLSAVTA